MTANHILEHVWLGSVADCDTFAKLGEGRRLNLMYPYQLCPIPICYPLPCLEGSQANPESYFVPVENLEAAADYIQKYRDKPMLVHCWMGIERSPLTVAWWLRKFHGYSLEEAYKLLVEKRPIIQDRRMWIRPGVRE